MAAAQVENWDEDDDLQGDLFSYSVSTVQTNASSSRMSVNSESIAAEEDWHVPITPNDEKSTFSAISSAKHAGIPIPKNVPQSALLGGSIKKLGKKKSRPKIEDDWGEDLELPPMGGVKLKLNAGTLQNQLPTPPLGDEDDLDWADGSLGMHSAGIRRDVRGRSSSVSAMSPSMNSIMTLESEDDGMDGLVLPEGPLDFNTRLKKQKEKELTATDSQQPLQSEMSERPHEPQKSSEIQELSEKQDKEIRDEGEDFAGGIDFGQGSFLDRSKHKINRNIKVNIAKEQQPAASRVATTLTFTDKPSVSRIPRPKPSRLDPVYESGASLNNQSRPGPTTTSAQLLRAKRSAPVLRGNFLSGQKSATPFLPAGPSSSQSHHVNARPGQSGPRRDSDPSKLASPTSSRPFSRLSTIPPPPETPSRSSTRAKNMTPSSLPGRELPGHKKTITRPAKKRQFGDGSELEIFDDLPTSATKESKYIKAPLNRMGSRQNLRRQQSISKLPLPDRMTTPLPHSPAPTTNLHPRTENLPRFARDTAASRIAREQRLATTRPRGEGPLMPITTNWKAQVAARNPHNSPSAMRNKRKGTGQRPLLINPLNSPTLDITDENGMVYDPILQRWEGNEGALTPFMSTFSEATHTTTQPPLAQQQQQHHQYQHRHHTPHRSIGTTSTTNAAPTIAATTTAPPSPPRPALISNIASAHAVRVERGMVFDPRRMCWLKMDPASRDPLSPSAGTVDGDDDDEDPFAGLDDLKDENETTGNGNNNGGRGGGGGGGGGGLGKSGSGAAAADEWLVGEEFDLGPEFIRRQREEEGNWRKRVDAWTGPRRDALGEEWRWLVKDAVPTSGWLAGSGSGSGSASALPVPGRKRI